MNYVGQIAETVLGTVKELYKGLNPATLTGCTDVIVVSQPDGSLHCSPFHVRFGKLRVLRSSEKVVDIEINGEPVNLHMKLGDNGEAFFVQESEEQEERIPTFLCTSPIPSEKTLEPLTRSANLHGSSDGLGSDPSLQKKRRRKKKPKRRESSANSTSEEEGTGRERCLKEKRNMLVSSNTLYYSFADIQSEEAGTLHPKEAHPFSDGELAPLQSLSPNCSSAPKSDSELEIRKPEHPLGSESQLQWAWGRLPEVSKLDLVEATKFVSNVSATAAIGQTTTVPVDETTHFMDISGGSESDLGTVDSEESSSSLIVRPTPIFASGNTLSGGEGPYPSRHILGNQLHVDQVLPGDTQTVAADSGPHSKKELAAQTQDLNLEEPSLSLKESIWTNIEPCSGPELKLEKRRSSLKKNPHLGPTDVYLDELSDLDAEQLALYFPKRMEGITADSSSDVLMKSVGHNQVFPLFLSLCGGLGDDGELSHEKFMKHIVSYEEFVENPAILEDPNLVIQIQEKYYSWAVAAPMLLSLQAFQKNLPKSTVDKLMKEKMPKKGGRWWFSWRRKELSDKEHESGTQKFKRAGRNRENSSLQRGEDDSSSDDDVVPTSQEGRSNTDAITQKFLPTYKKSLRLSSDQIRKLNLRDGANEVVFSVTTQFQGTCRCEASIYLWNWNDKVVISDIDGTITRSNTLGYILPQFGKDWTHQGIAKLFHKIHLNGYKFLYCSARTIGLAHITKGYLDCVKDQGWGLPKGPVLLAPSSVLSALHREVIENKPEVFKIACLTDIRNLFATNIQPFHAAFGNRTNDVYAYKKVALPESRIFTVNTKGEVTQEFLKITKSTYDRLSEVVEFIFPPIGEDEAASLACPEFSQFSYWRLPLPSVDFENAV